MPRNPAAKKNQHNHKHENGLVGPGKRIARQKSNGQINGSPRAAHPDTPPPTPLISTSFLNGQADIDANDSSSDAKQDVLRNRRGTMLRTRDSESSYDGHDSTSNRELRPSYSEDMLHRQEDKPVRHKVSHEISHLRFASTILKSCPAYDTIAILILLLQLPPIILTIVQALFAALPFMPPTGISVASMFSLFDVFQGSAGAPSLGTMIFVDAICFGLWFCLWSWAQNFALDLAQVQIAITLGGGSTGKRGGVNGLCLFIVLVLHLVRSKGVRDFFFGRLFPSRIMANHRISQIARLMPSEAEFGTTPPSPSWLHSLFAVHIVTQALMAFIRRRVATSQANSASKSSKRSDTETSAGAHSQQELSTTDAGGSASFASGPDFQPPLTPGFKDGKEKAVSAKKRRRQVTQVSSRQPFWTALANLKVISLREYEHSRGSSRNAIRQIDEDPETRNGDEIVWITHVDSSTIEFEAANIPNLDEDQGSSSSSSNKPFYVRINGAPWCSFSSNPANDPRGPGSGPTIYSGEISGLAPNCTYTCSFIRTDDDVEFCAIMVKTPALLEKDHLSSLVPPLPPQSFRPSSPTTTIKNSIQTAEAKLIDARNRLVKSRRSHKATLSKIEKEVDSFNTRLKYSSDDTKQKQKLLQVQNSIRQNEDASLSISAAIDNLDVIPEEEVAEYSSRKEAFQKQCELLSAANEALATARSEAQSEISRVKSELSSAVARRERLTARQTRLAEQHDRITQANAQGMNEKERKAADSILKEAEQARVDSDYRAQFDLITREIESLHSRTTQTWQEIQAFEKRALMQREAMLKSAGPLTPEGNLPGTNPPHHASSRSFGFGFPQSSTISQTTPFPDAGQNSPFLAYAKTLPTDNFRRPRSASNRSGGALSNFSADFDDADPIPPMPAVGEFGINERKDSDSSQGKNNGSPGSLNMGGLASPVKGGVSPKHGIW